MTPRTADEATQHLADDIGLEPIALAVMKSPSHESGLRSIRRNGSPDRPTTLIGLEAEGLVTPIEGGWKVTGKGEEVLKIIDTARSRARKERSQ